MLTRIKRALRNAHRNFCEDPFGEIKDERRDEAIHQVEREHRVKPIRIDSDQGAGSANSIPGKINPTVTRLCEALRDQGIRSVVLMGDHRRRHRAVAWCCPGETFWAWREPRSLEGVQRDDRYLEQGPQRMRSQGQPGKRHGSRNYNWSTTSLDCGTRFGLIYDERPRIPFARQAYNAVPTRDRITSAGCNLKAI